MADTSTTKRPDGLLWRLALLHPGWMAVPLVGVVCVVAVPLQLLAQDLAIAEAASLALSVPFYLLGFGYGFLIVAITSGRFYARRPRRLLGPCLALGIVAAVPLVVVLAALLSDTLEPLGVEAWPESVLPPAVTVFFAAGYYLFFRGSVDLVDAERGFGGGTGRKIGTFILFIFWIFGFFFLQARLRRLALRFDAGRGKRLPMEKLEPLALESGAFALLLTEAVARREFDTYADLLVERLDGHVKGRRELPRGPCWDIEIEGSDFRLRFDSASKRVILEPEGDSAELLLDHLRTWFAPVEAPAAT